MNRTRRPIGEAAWLVGEIVCALGVCLSAKSGFGVSMVVAPAYVLYQKISALVPGFTFGMGEYCVQGLLILLLGLVLHRFKWKYLLSFGTAVCYGLALDAWRLIFGTEIYGAMWQRIAFGAVGAVITAFSIALLLRTYLPQAAYELTVKEITEHFSLRMNRVKWIYDLSSLLVAILLMLALFGTFSLEMVGIGTLVMTAINAPLIALSGTWLDRHFDFSPAWPVFHEKFQRVMD